MSGHIEPGCTLLTVDCLVRPKDAARLRHPDGVREMARTLATGPLGKLGEVTVGIGAHRASLSEDSDAEPTAAAAAAAAARGAILDQDDDFVAGESDSCRPELFVAQPQCVCLRKRIAGDTELDAFSGEESDYEDASTSSGAKSFSATSASTVVNVTFPAAALRGASLRCRLRGRAVPVSIVGSTVSQGVARNGHAVQYVTLSVSITVSGVDGVAMLELVRSRCLEDVSIPPGGASSQQEDETTATGRSVAGVPVGYPIVAFLVVSDFGVYAALQEMLQPRGGVVVDVDTGSPSPSPSVPRARDSSVLYALGKPIHPHTRAYHIRST